MTHHTWKPYNFIQLKTGLQRNVQRIHSFNKTASSINDILKPGPEPLPDLRHGVPGEGPHHLLDLRDLGLCLIVKLCSDLQLRNAPRKIVPGLQAGELGGQISFSHTSIRFFLSQSCVLLLLSAGFPVHCVQDCFLAVTYLTFIKFAVSADPLQAINSSNHHLSF